MPDLLEQLCPHARLRPDAIALRQYRSGDGAGTTTFAALHAAARAYADLFASETPNSAVVPLLLGKSAACVAAMLGAAGAGRAFACLNRKLKLPQIAEILERTGPTLALTDGPGVMALAAATGDSPVAGTRWRVIDDGALLTPHRNLIGRLSGMMDITCWSPPASPGAFQPQTESAIDRAACCLFTSGSTGTPKGVLMSGQDLLARARAEVDWFGLSSGDVLLNILPFSFDVGLNQLLASLAAGCELVLLDSWLPADILRAAAEYRVTGISGVPAIWADLLAAGLRFDTGGAHRALRYITVSGGDLSPAQLEQLPSLAPGVGIHKTYGQSEAFRTAALRPEQFTAKTRSVGRPFHGVRVYVVREGGTPCATNEEGEIVHTGLGVMLGYLGDTSTGEKLRPNPFFGPADPARNAVFTGDLGHLDADGYLHVHGRRDAMLKIAGNRVYPAEIAAQLLAIPGVREAEVVGVKAEGGETVLVAFLAHDAAPDLRRESAARLPSYMVPRHFVSVGQIPRTSSGKPDRPALLEQARTFLAAARTTGTTHPSTRRSPQ